MASSTVSPEQQTGVAPRMLNHAAFIAHDASVTTDFYTRVLRMELVNSVIDDRIPSTGDPIPYFHLFFRMGDGSTIAFFVAPGLPAAPPPSHAAYGIFNHLAFHTDSLEELMSWKDRLEQNGVKVLGPVNHDGAFVSIYFHDPNGVRLEFTRPQSDDWNNQGPAAQEDLQRWCGVIDAAKKEGRDVTQALLDYIRSERAARKGMKDKVHEE